MFRILLVDDDPSVRVPCQQELSKWPCISVDWASSVEEGEHCILHALQQQLPYDGALLDFKLPSTDPKKDVEPINESLCASLRTGMNNCFVLHMTAFEKNQRVRDHMEKFHSGIRGSHADLVEKKKSDAEDTCTTLLKFVVSRHTHQLLDRLLVPRPILRGSGFLPSGWPHLSASHQLAELQYVVRELYNFIDPETYDRLTLHFNVELKSKMLAFLPRVG